MRGGEFALQVRRRLGCRVVTAITDEDDIAGLCDA